MNRTGRRDSPRNEREAAAEFAATTYLGRRSKQPTPRPVRSPWPPVFVAAAVAFGLAMGGAEVSAQHTLGPWYCDASNADKESWNVCGGPDAVYLVAEVMNGNSFPQNAANARLIAAAPELLEACKRCVGSLGVASPGGAGDPDVMFAQAAIAKATRSAA